MSFSGYLPICQRPYSNRTQRKLRTAIYVPRSRSPDSARAIETHMPAAGVRGNKRGVRDAFAATRLRSPGATAQQRERRNHKRVYPERPDDH